RRRIHRWNSAGRAPVPERAAALAGVLPGKRLRRLDGEGQEPRRQCLRAPHDHGGRGPLVGACGSAGGGVFDIPAAAAQVVRIRFLTSTPQDIRRGSGTYVGISVLAQALARLGHTVVWERPRAHFPVYTLERWWFNRGLRPSAEYGLTVGFDLDGYRI